MQTRLDLAIFLGCFITLSACSPSLEDEKFEFTLPTDYPKLGYVPSRPTLPNMNKINQDQEALQHDVEHATQRKQGVFKELSINPDHTPSKKQDD
jgi:hypothetical protein